METVDASSIVPQVSLGANSESIIHLFGLDWTLNTLVQMSVATIGIVTLLFIAYQSYLSRRSGEVGALFMRYSMILESNKFIFQHPEFVPLSMSAKRFEMAQNMSLDDRRELAAYELLLDNFEFYFLVGYHENRSHAESFARKLLGNPALQKFLSSERRGTFRSEFSQIIDEAIAIHRAKVDLEKENQKE